MENLNKKIIACQNCSLHELRTRVITGEGNLQSKLLLLGEAPGGHEDYVSGRVFTGAAGDELEEFLAAIGIPREEIYLTNTVKCRPVRPSTRGRFGPYANRPPKTTEIRACFNWFRQELEIVKPKIIVTLGATPLIGLLGKRVKMHDYHGKAIFNEKAGIYLFPLYHPASVIYNPGLKPLYLEDLKNLRKFLKEELNIHFNN